MGTHLFNLNMELSQRYQYEVNDEGDLVTTAFKVPQSLEVSLDVGQISSNTETSVRDVATQSPYDAPSTVSDKPEVDLPKADDVEGLITDDDDGPFLCPF